MLEKWYDDITVTTVEHEEDGTYSSDTSMHEVMLVAQKRSERRSSGDPTPRIKFVQLDSMPSSRMEALTISKVIRETEVVRLEDDVGVTSLIVGSADTVVGRAVSCPIETDMPWVCRRVRNIGLLQFAYNLARGRFFIPEGRKDGKSRNGTPTTASPIALLGSFLDMGRHHLDVIGAKTDGTPRGPFNKRPISKRSKYKCLWNNDANSQQCMIVDPDCSLEAKHDATREHIATIWATSGRVHLNNQVGYGSQRLIAAYTNDCVLGGASWPNVIGLGKNHEKAFTLWCNSTFGLLLYWFVAGGQQRGRGRMGVDSLRKTFSVLNVRQLDDAKLARFDDLFDATCRTKLGPFNNPSADRTRRRIDEGIARILGMSVDLDELYAWIESEPQISNVGSERTNRA